MTEQEVRQLVKDSGVRLIENKLVQGTWGNISIRLDDTHMVVTPSGLDYIRLKPSDMVVVNIETMEYDSPIKPTSEKKLHAAILRERKDINAVIHSHPSYCCSVAASRVEMPVMSEEMQRLIGGSAKVAAYGLPGTKKLTEATMLGLKDRNACFMANHGMMACGKDIDEAFLVCKVLEESSRLFIEKQCSTKLGKSIFAFGDLEKIFAEKFN